MCHFFEKVIEKILDSDSLTPGVVSKLNQNFDCIKRRPLNCDFLIIYKILKENSRYWSVLVGIFGIFSKCPNLTF